MRRACRECRIHPRGFVKSSLGLIIPGMKDMITSPLSFQSCIAKCWISMWRDRSVGTRALTILIADWLSQYKVVAQNSKATVPLRSVYDRTHCFHAGNTLYVPQWELHHGREESSTIRSWQRSTHLNPMRQEQSASATKQDSTDCKQGNWIRGRTTLRTTPGCLLSWWLETRQMMSGLEGLCVNATRDLSG